MSGRVRTFFERINAKWPWLKIALVIVIVLVLVVGFWLHGRQLVKIT